MDKPSPSDMKIRMLRRLHSVLECRHSKENDWCCYSPEDPCSRDRCYSIIVFTQREACRFPQFHGRGSLHVVRFLPRQQNTRNRPTRTPPSVSGTYRLFMIAKRYQRMVRKELRSGRLETGSSSDCSKDIANRSRQWRSRLMERRSPVPARMVQSGYGMRSFINRW